MLVTKSRRPARLYAVSASLAVSVALLAGLAPVATAEANPPTAEVLAAAIAEREVYGLPTDSQTMRELFAGTNDVGTPEWGVPMTAAEEEEIDLLGRMTFVSNLEEGVLPWVRSLPTYAGAWIDQKKNGGLIVMLTQLEATTMDQIAARMPAESRGLEFRAAPVAYEKLMAASAAARAAWSRHSPQVTIHGLAIDTINNRLRVVVDPDHLDLARSHADAVATDLGVPLALEGGQASEDAACSSAWSCWGPMRGGTLIWNDAPRSGPDQGGWYCSMGFHIRIGTDEQYLTAAHCGWRNDNGSSPPAPELRVADWHIWQFGFVGNKLQAWGGGAVQNGEDVMRNAMLDSQASRVIFGESPLVSATAQWPVVNSTVCARLGRTAIEDCGTVTHDQCNWTSSTMEVNVFGGCQSGILTNLGDSGSPLYRYVRVQDVWFLKAVGIIDTTAPSQGGPGGFSRVLNALDFFDAAMLD